MYFQIVNFLQQHIELKINNVHSILCTVICVKQLIRHELWIEDLNINALIKTDINDIRLFMSNIMCTFKKIENSGIDVHIITNYSEKIKDILSSLTRFLKFQ